MATKRDVWNDAPKARTHTERMKAATPDGDGPRVFTHGSLTDGFRRDTPQGRRNAERVRNLRPNTLAPPQ